MIKQVVKRKRECMCGIVETRYSFLFLLLFLVPEVFVRFSQNSIHLFIHSSPIPPKKRFISFSPSPYLLHAQIKIISLPLRRQLRFPTGCGRQELDHLDDLVSVPLAFVVDSSSASWCYCLPFHPILFIIIAATTVVVVIGGCFRHRFPHDDTLGRRRWLLSWAVRRSRRRGSECAACCCC